MNRDTDIDEAFASFRENLIGYTDALATLTDEDAGLRISVEAITIETPVELDLRVAEDGSVTLGCAPPLYRVDTTVAPVLHQLRFTAVPDPLPPVT